LARGADAKYEVQSTQYEPRSRRPPPYSVLFTPYRTLYSVLRTPYFLLRPPPASRKPSALLPSAPLTPRVSIAAKRSRPGRRPRCELIDLRAAFRRYYRRPVELLTWHGAGRVWAADHVVPPDPIDGVDRAALAAGDLASGAQLAWQPVPNQKALPAVAVFKSLIAEHGPPLVLKSDNGSAFKSHAFSELLAEHEIVWLPGDCPNFRPTKMGLSPLPASMLQWRV
jgi:hypothetical protein